MNPYYAENEPQLKATQEQMPPNMVEFLNKLNAEMDNTYAILGNTYRTILGKEAPLLIDEKACCLLQTLDLLLTKAHQINAITNEIAKGIGL